MARRTRRKGIVAKEEQHKAKARKRDGGRCRLPFCPNCKAFKNLIPQVAHVIHAKGIGGDPTQIRSQPNQLMVLDPITHGYQEHGEIDVVPLTYAGTNGPCEFHLVDDVYNPKTSRYRTVKRLWAREKAVGVPDAPLPYTSWRVARRAKEQD